MIASHPWDYYMSHKYLCSLQSNIFSNHSGEEGLIYFFSFVQNEGKILCPCSVKTLDDFSERSTGINTEGLILWGVELFQQVWGALNSGWLQERRWRGMSHQHPSGTGRDGHSAGLGMHSALCRNGSFILAAGFAQGYAKIQMITGRKTWLWWTPNRIETYPITSYAPDCTALSQ